MDKKERLYDGCKADIIVMSDLNTCLQTKGGEAAILIYGSLFFS